MALWQDLRFAVRTSRKSPGFAVLAALTLALGIGANTAIFSIVNGVLLAPLHYPKANRIVAISSSWPQRALRIPRVTGGDVVDIRADHEVFDSFGYYFGGELGVQLRDHAEFTPVYFVQTDFFNVFGTTPAYGRAFQGDDAERAAVVGLAFAQRNFGSGAAAVNQAIQAEGQTYQIVGVAPVDFGFPRQAQVWLAAPLTPQNLNRTAYNYRAIASLKPGVGVEAANAHLATLAARLQTAFPKSNQGETFVAESLRDQLAGPVRSTLLFLMGAVSVVLLIACANVANLMLARASARAREMAVRTALGAGRHDIIRQLLVESALIACLGGVLGLLLAAMGTPLLLRVTAQQMALPRLNEIHVSWAVLAFAIGISAIASLLFGLSPAWQASRVNLHDTLKQAGARGVVASSSGRLRDALVVAQIALSFVLAIGAGLLFRTFLALNSVELGYRTEGVLVMYAHAPARGLQEYLEAGRFFERLVADLQQVPGVTSVAAAMGLPTGDYGSNGSYAVEGRGTLSSGQRLPHAEFALASPGYFSTMAIPLRRGRDFNRGDDYEAPAVAVISESLARQSFPHEDPIGRRIQCGLDAPIKWMTIVGIVGDVHQDSPGAPVGPSLYMPVKQHPYYGNELQVVVRSAVAPQSLIETVRKHAQAMNPQLATKFTTMDTMVADSIAAPRVRMLLVGSFAALALLLAMTGMYGVLSYITTQRVPEFGVRMALGAAPRQVLQLVLNRALQLIVVGVAFGLILALAAGRVISSMLFGLKTTDAITYALVLLAVMPIVLLAAIAPAWRAAHVDPLIALREE